MAGLLSFIGDFLSGRSIGFRLDRGSQAVWRPTRGNPEGSERGGFGDGLIDLLTGTLYLKRSGSGTTGWVAIATIEGCTTVFDVGPGCQFPTINEAYAAAIAAGHDFDNQAEILVAPQAGGYPEDLTLTRSGIHIIGTMGVAQDGAISSDSISLVLPKLVGTLTVAIVLDTDRERTRAIVAGIDIEAPAGANAIVMTGADEVEVDFIGGGAVSLDTVAISWLHTNAQARFFFRGGAKARCLAAGIAVVESALGSAGTLQFLGSQILAPARGDICLNLGGSFRIFIFDSSSALQGTITLADTSQVFFRGGCAWTGGVAAASMATLAAGTILELEQVRVNSQTSGAVDHIAGTGTVNYGRLFGAATTELPFRFAGGLTVGTDRTQGAETEVYAPAVSGDWTGADPTTVQEALDRIAAQISPVA